MTDSLIVPSGYHHIIVILCYASIGLVEIDYVDMSSAASLNQSKNKPKDSFGALSIFST